MKKVFMKAGNRTLSKRLFSIMLIIGILFSMMPDATYADNSGRPPDAIEQEDTENTESEMSDNKAAEPEQNTESDETAQDESSCQDTQAQDVQTEENEGNHDNEVMTTYVRSHLLNVVTSGSGTFDVYINGRLKASGCNNFHQNIQYDRYNDNTRYEIRNIRAATGYYFIDHDVCYEGIMQSDVNIVLRFQAKRTQVTFYRNINSSDTIKAGQTFTGGVSGQSFSDKKWTKTGYTLLGWAEGRNATAQQYSTLSPVTDDWIDAKTPNIESNVALYAVWGRNNYSISYTLNGGSISGQPTSYNVETDSFTLPQPTRSGYTFIGWTGTGLSGLTKTVTVSKGSIGNRSYTANWTPINCYTVSFNYNKPSTATGTMSGNGTTNKGVTSAAAYGTLPQPSIPGWTFDGWYTAASGGSKISATTTYTATGNQTLYAHWTLNTYSISYNANGGSLSGQKTSYNIETANFTLPTPTRNGYTFTGWTGSNGTTAQKSVTIVKGSTGNKSYTANWSINSYYLNLNGWLDGARHGDTSGFGTFDVYINGTLKANDCVDFYQQIPYGSKWEIKDIKATTGHYYNGVHSGSLTGTMGTSGVEIMLDFSTKKTTVTFYRNINSSDTTTAVQTFTYGVSGQSFSDKKWTKTGYTLLGWAETRNATAQKYNTLSPVVDGWINEKTPQASSNVALYAVWSRNNYSISYTLNGGSISG